MRSQEKLGAVVTLRVGEGENTQNSDIRSTQLDAALRIICYQTRGPEVKLDFTTGISYPHNIKMYP
jgi:hypothetical protein